MKQWQRQPKAAGIFKRPSLDALQAEYAALQEQKEALYADYCRLWKTEKASRGIRCYQEEYRQPFESRMSVGTEKEQKGRWLQK